MRRTPPGRPEFRCRGHFVERVYNTKRRHSALGYLSPNEFERAAAKGATRRAGTTNHHDRTIGFGAVRIDDLEVHSGLHKLHYPSVLGKTSRPPAIAHLSAGDESSGTGTLRGSVCASTPLAERPTWSNPGDRAD